ncbi:MAG: ABC transporter permease [Firmicutes bacterium HGW-Firmicutes-20]|jgi:peptide/nickel transport system permease protein|nr:MAG: ABC transporter permease [Firmicutes bacterium HGW-Firmicutes-20]
MNHETQSGPWRSAFRRLINNRSSLIGLIVLISLILIAIFADQIAPFSFREQNLDATFLMPNSVNLFGTDNFGRDIFSRVIYGTRISLMVGVISVSIALIVGGSMGAMAGYIGGYFDTITMRFVDILISIPSILLAISISVTLGGGLRNVMIAVGIGSIPSYARVMRASVLSIKELQYIEAARALGTRKRHILIRHIVPNTLAPIIVQATLGVAGAILAAAGLGFIGLGIEPPNPEWGAMLNAGRQFIRDYPHMSIYPGVAIMITILSLNLLGDGLRDALDPKMDR